MTPENKELDPGIFLTDKPLTLYRIAATRWADLSGMGSALYPGRWNRLGEPAIYTSTEIGTCVLEKHAHIADKSLIPSNLSLMTIQVSANWEPRYGNLSDDLTDAAVQIFRSIGSAESRRHRKAPRRIGYGASPLADGFSGPMAIAVPSVIVPAWNVVLFPLGVAFWKHTSLRGVEPFTFDPRNFPVDARQETIE